MNELVERVLTLQNKRELVLFAFVRIIFGYAADTLAKVSGRNFAMFNSCKEI